MNGVALMNYLEGIPGGNFVLHGSPFKMDVVEPRQSIIDNDERPEYSECGIYSSGFAQIALLYALFHEDRNEWGFTANFRKTKTVNVFTIRELVAKPGYLYVLPVAPFTKVFGGGCTGIAYEPIVPLERLSVDADVLNYLQAEQLVRIHTSSTAS